MDKFDNSSPKKLKSNIQDYTTMVHINKKVPPLEGGKYQKIGGM